MKKLVERLLLFFVGLPLIIASVFFLPQYHYLVLHIELLAFSVIAILEMRSILSHKLPVHGIAISLCIGLAIPVAAFLYTVFGLPQRIITFSIAIASVLVLFIEFLLSFSGKFDKAIERIASSFILLIYPSYLLMYLAIMTVWHDAGILLSVFFLMVFGCDSLAWFFGMLLGKNNRGIIPASPNKSVAGFFGGYAGAIAVGVVAKILFPEVFVGGYVKIIALGFMTATAAIVGDIIESVFKRSAGIKDSGHVIPGRGGVLDSVDSILLAAPVFYIICDFLYGMA
ncbi:MAG TPA: phosphatidate cytidylyltransferase [Treponemataceae bacterium]|nr:phosphatidate cytidylyltransferase [Treponemataceae bacterium]